MPRTTMYRQLIIAAVSLATLASGLPAQTEYSRSFQLYSAAALAEFDGPARISAGGLVERALYTMGGALVGAGLGYFTSQVDYSDWDKSSNGSFLDQRRMYSAGGATVGALAGLLIGNRRDGRRLLVESGKLAGAEGVETIQREEIEEAGAVTVYQLIQSLRPEWFRIRGSKSILEQGVVIGDDRTVTAFGGTPEIVTYLDNARLGGVDDLRRIVAIEAQSITRLSAAQASLHIGPGHPHGAIVVSLVEE